MNNFNYFAPTEVRFGRDVELETGEVAKKYGSRAVLVFGKNSVRNSGLLDRVEKSLQDAGVEFVEFGGAKPNPTVEHAEEGVKLALDSKADLIIALGGGSAIDTAKAIAHGTANPEADLWDIWTKKVPLTKTMPVGAVLTIPAAGSEMSSSCVITKDEGLNKRGFNCDLCRCKFAVMNPERTYTLPAYQTAAGATDIMMHTMERYFSKYEDMTLTDAISEALLRTVKDAVLVVLEHPEDYRNRAQIMWASSLAHNDLTELGLDKDFATHKMEHELSALFGVTHGAGLAAIWPSWARYVKDKHLSRFVRFAVNVMGIENDFAHPDETAEKGIRAVEEFYHKIGMPINIHELLGREITTDEIEEMVNKCSRDGTITLGAMEVIDTQAMRTIYEMAK
jgi:alcohol dehydrogenase YqhD (iron-dependent ADH family)